MNSVLICNPDGKLLLSRYFEAQSHGSECAFEPSSGGEHTAASSLRDTAKGRSSTLSEVLGQTRHLWTKGTAECPQVARAKGGLIIVFGAVEDLLLFLCGSGECDELTLADMLATLAKVIVALCRQGGKHQRATETAFLSSNGTSSIYSKACLVIDEMIPGGILESLDSDGILSSIKLQKPTSAAPVAGSKKGR
ncbi:unnamed protein product [Ectocarpus sp. 6 AP-2014]